MFINIEQHDWTPDFYHAYDAVSNSTLSRMVKDPLKTHEPVRVSDSMKIGSAADELILTPERFVDNWNVVRDVVAPSGANQSEFCKRLMAGDTPEAAAASAYKRPPTDPQSLAQQFAPWIELQTENALSETDMHLLNRLKESVMNHEQAAALLRDSRKQVCFTGTHKDTGIRVKGMLDMWLPAESLEVDLKTTSTPWEKINRWWLRDRGYHTQRAMYCELSGATCTGILVVRTSGRHRTRLFDLTVRMEEENWKGALDQRIREYAWRKKHDRWEHAVSYYQNSGWEVL